MALDILVEFFSLLCSIIVLGISSNIVIKNAEKIAKITKIGEMVLGFILLSLISSIPEMAVAFSSITEQAFDVSIGNIFGGSIQRITLLLGILAFLTPISILESDIKNVSIILYLTSTMPFLIIMGIPNFIVGILLIITFIYFCYYAMKRKIVLTEKGFVWKGNFLKLLALVCFGLGLVIISSRVAVVFATIIARRIGISESIIGATILSFGTVLPEFSLSLASLKRRKFSLLIGNLIGSNLTVLGLVLGIILLSPFSISDFSAFSLLFINLLIANVALWILFREGTLERSEGLFLIFLYIIFLISLIGLEI